MDVLRHFRNVPKFFYQSDNGNDESFDYTKYNMGLKPLYTGTEEETNWETFSRQVKRMNLLSGKGIQYKVFFFSSYATKDELVDGGRRRSSTAKSQRLLPKSIDLLTSNESSLEDDSAQWRDMYPFLISQIKYENMPLPQSFYTSSSSMALQLLDMTYSRLPFHNGLKFKPLGHELLREADGLSPRTSYDGINITEIKDSDSGSCSSEVEFSPPTLQESDADRDVRMRYFLDDIFEHDDSTFISVTCHAELLAALLRTIGHRPLTLATGEILPVLIKCE